MCFSLVPPLIGNSTELLLPISSSAPRTRPRPPCPRPLFAPTFLHANQSPPFSCSLPARTDPDSLNNRFGLAVNAALLPSISRLFGVPSISNTQICQVLVSLFRCANHVHPSPFRPGRRSSIRHRFGLSVPVSECNRRLCVLFGNFFFPSKSVFNATKAVACPGAFSVCILIPPQTHAPLRLGHKIISTCWSLLWRLRPKRFLISAKLRSSDDHPCH